MKFLKSFIAAIPLLALNIKKANADDEFFGNVTRSELFETIDFKIPSIKIQLSDDDYKNLFLSYECKKLATPSFIKRKEECYTAPWVDLNYALSKSIKKNYIKRNKITDENDKKLVEKVVDKNNYNITLSEFESLSLKYANLTLEEIFSTPYGLAKPPEKYFETEKVSMIFDLDGKDVQKFTDVKFSIGGRSTKFFAKVGYNINIKDKTLLHGSKQLRLRPVVVDPSFMRDKLAYDLHTLIGLQSLNANYCRLYINDIFMGLYLIRDAFKSKWVENTFGEKSTKHLYTCSNQYYNRLPNDFFNCVNDDDDKYPIEKDKDYQEFIQKLEKAKTREDLEEFFDVKTFIRLQASRYLFGSLDQITGENNNVVYMYHNKITEKDLWVPLIYDFDMNFGNFKVPNTRRTFDEEIYDKENPLFSILGLNDSSTELISVMDDIMRKAFNPMILIKRIDELRSFLDPYVKEDRTPGENGRLPGRFDIAIGRPHDSFTYDDFINNTEFTTIKSIQYHDNFSKKSTDDIALGLKQWVIERFQFACEHYNIDCSYADEYLDSPYFKNYKIKEVKRVQQNEGCKGTGYACCIFPNTQKETSDESGDWGRENGEWCLIVLEYKEPENEEECWSLEQGYPCCEKKSTTVEYTSKNGRQWGVENNNWCGITKVQTAYKEICPVKDNYKCCSNCDVYYTDSLKWGVENGDWCLIPYYCEGK